MLSSDLFTANTDKCLTIAVRLFQLYSTVAIKGLAI